MHDTRKGITAVIEPEAAIAGLNGQRAILHLFAQLRGTGPRLLFFSCSYSMTTTEAEHQMSYDGIHRAIAGIELALELVTGDRPIDGVHPDNLVWFRDILDHCPGQPPSAWKICQ